MTAYLKPWTKAAVLGGVLYPHGRGTLYPYFHSDQRKKRFDGGAFRAVRMGQPLGRVTLSR